MKYTLVTAALAILIALCGVGGYVVVKSATIRGMDEKYSRITREDDAESLVRLFGEPHQVWKNPENVFWDDAVTKPNAGEVLVEYRYTADTFYLPIIWAFGVDKGGRVISKHRYD